MNLRSLSGVLSGAAVLLLLVLQALPWAGSEVPETTVPGFSSPYYSMPSMTVGGGEVKATTWNVEYSSDEASADEGWYSEDFDDRDDGAVGLIRAAIPLLLAGAAIALAAVLVTLLMRGILGPVLALVGAAVLTVATLLFANGIDEVFEGTDYTWLAGLYVAIAACVLALAGGVVGLVGRNAEPVRSANPA